MSRAALNSHMLGGKSNGQARLWSDDPAHFYCPAE